MLMASKISRLIFSGSITAGLSIVPLPLARGFLSLLQRNPRLTDGWGFHVRPISFYEPLPDFGAIQAEYLRKRRSSPALDWRAAAQVQLIGQLAAHVSDFKTLAETGRFDFANPWFGGLDAAVYYCLVRFLKPSRIIEVGSGYSTQIAQLALDDNSQDGRPGEQYCIEPFPERLNSRRLPVHLIQDKLEAVPLEFFHQLGPGDIVLIDSTHTVKFGSDVCREVLDILPRLQPGVWVHFHDIFLPWDYPESWLLERRLAWNEQYLLEAFLAYNSHFQIELANHWLASDHPQEAAHLWPEASSWPAPSHKCGSFWIRKRK